MSIKTWNSETQSAEPLVPGAIEKEHYSTEEVKTNKTWIDGKPIYRKTIKGSFSGSSGSWIHTEVAVGNIETFISGFGITNTKQSYPLIMGNDNAVISAIFNRVGSQTFTSITVEYTKTTD